MLSSLGVVAGQVLTLFLLMGVGFTLRRIGKLPAAAASAVTFILLYVVTPCTIVVALSGERGANSLVGMGLAGLGCVIFFVVAALITMPFFRKRERDTRGVLRFASIYPNAGFMGFPLVRSIFGDEAMPHAAVFMVIFLVLQWTHGVLLIGGREKVSPKNALFNPGTVSFAVAMALFFLNARLPWPVGNAVTFLNDLNTPLAMIVIGAQMADADILSLLRRPVLYLSASLRLIAVPALVLLALLPLKLPPLVFCTTVILSAAPSAGATAMFAQRFDSDTQTAASAVSLSTLLSIITLPVFAVLSKTLTLRFK